MSLVWCLVRWIINDRKKERQRMQHIKINASKKMHMQKQLARSISDIEVQKQLARSISDIEAQKQIASVDTTDGSGSDDDFDNRYKVKIERPLFFRVISWWAYLELMIIAYVMLTKPLEDFPDNFLNGLCHNHQCQRIITRALCYKILSSVFLAFGAKLQFMFFMTPWLIINVLGVFPLSTVIVSAHYEYADIRTRYSLLVSLFVGANVV